MPCTLGDDEDVPYNDGILDDGENIGELGTTTAQGIIIDFVDWISYSDSSSLVVGLFSLFFFFSFYWCLFCLLKRVRYIYLRRYATKRRRVGQ